MKTRNFILGFLIVFTLAWAFDALYISPITGDTPWLIRKNFIYISGVLSMALMSLAMVLALRPVSLEPYFGGMDKIYHVHKWAGILAILFGLAHWLAKLGGGLIADVYGTTGKPARDAVLYFMTDMRGFGKDLGEWSIYLLLALLAMAIIKKIPYGPWRVLHKVMPAIYLALVIHTLALTPLNYWTGISGVLLATMLLAGSYASLFALAQQIGKSRLHYARIKNINIINNDVLEISCTVDSNWPGHKAGQFAFLRFDNQEAAHPFTIASSYKNNNRLDFKIKGLGDYTKTLANTVHQGQIIEIEGPYGKFNYNFPTGSARQIWVAAGIGITPFISWLQDLQGKQLLAPIDMHYCVRDARNDKLVALVKNLCTTQPYINLYIHDQQARQRLNAEFIVKTMDDNNDKYDLWFCGPNRFANSLKKGFNKLQLKNINFHQEIFEMR